jgi:hypothetical protein
MPALAAKGKPTTMTRRLKLNVAGARSSTVGWILLALHGRLLLAWSLLALGAFVLPLLLGRSLLAWSLIAHGAFMLLVPSALAVGSLQSLHDDVEGGFDC